MDQRIQGHTDIPLNARGRWQAQQLVPALAGEALHAVYASDLGRAFETASGFALAAGLPVQTERSLRERHFGTFEGQRFDEIEARWPAQSARWRQRDPAFGPEGGETLAGFYDRCVSAIAALAARHAGQSIAIVTHGGVLDCLYRAATRADLQAPRTWQVGNAMVNRVLYTAQGFTLVGWSDGQHLTGEALDELRG